MAMIGGLPPPRPDQRYNPPGPPGPVGAAAGTLNARRVIITGPVDGLFVYDAAGGLRSADVGQVITDPLKGITCQQGRSTFNGHGAVITLSATALDAELLYADTGTSVQGALVASSASQGGIDPFGNAFLDGQVSYGVVGVNLACQNSVSKITFYAAPSPAGPWSAQGFVDGDNLGNLILGAGPGQSVFIASPFTLFANMIAFGAADATLNTDAAGYPTVTDGAGLTQQVSGSKLANPAAAGPYPIQDTGTGLTSLGFMTVPAGDAETGSSYQIHASGSFSTSASVPSSATFTVFWGGIGGIPIATLVVPGPLAASLSGAGWYLDAEINWISAASVKVTLVVGWHAGPGVTGSEVVFVIGSASGLATNVSENLSLGFQWGSAPAGTSLACEVFRASRVA